MDLFALFCIAALFQYNHLFPFFGRIFFGAGFQFDDSSAFFWLLIAAHLRISIENELDTEQCGGRSRPRLATSRERPGANFVATAN